MTLNDSKSILVTPEPGETKIPVTAYAQSRCISFIVFFHCSLQVRAERAR
jgi:hypothetical protein